MTTGLGKVSFHSNPKERQCTEWEKILSNDTTDKELIANVYKQLIGLKKIYITTL